MTNRKWKMCFRLNYSSNKTSKSTVRVYFLKKISTALVHTKMEENDKELY